MSGVPSNILEKLPISEVNCLYATLRTVEFTYLTEIGMAETFGYEVLRHTTTKHLLRQLVVHRFLHSEKI